MMRSLRRAAVILTPVLLLGACVSQPMGPTVSVMPAPGKPFDAFQADQALCKQYASGEVQGGAQQANNQQVATGVIGTVLGAGLGAAIGGGQGAAIGAGAGALGGTAVGPAGPVHPAGALQYGLRAVHGIPRQ
jgi:outer membrane lipoprotein SlyB